MIDRHPLGEYLGATALKSFIDSELALGETADKKSPGCAFRQTRGTLQHSPGARPKRVCSLALYATRDPGVNTSGRQRDLDEYPDPGPGQYIAVDPGWRVIRHRPGWYRVVQDDYSFTCAKCGDVCLRGPQEVSALDELEQNFSGTSVDECVSVCDDCYAEIMEWLGGQGARPDDGRDVTGSDGQGS